jgi:hypothetical protein
VTAVAYTRGRKHLEVRRSIQLSYGREDENRCRHAWYPGNFPDLGSLPVAPGRHLGRSRRIGPRRAEHTKRMGAAPVPGPGAVANSSSPWLSRATGSAVLVSALLGRATGGLGDQRGGQPGNLQPPPALWLRGVVPR